MQYLVDIRAIEVSQICKSVLIKCNISGLHYNNENSTTDETDEYDNRIPF